MFKLTIDTDNDAFADEPAPEVVRILREIADRLDAGHGSGYTRDINGNTVARWSFWAEDES